MATAVTHAQTIFSHMAAVGSQQAEIPNRAAIDSYAITTRDGATINWGSRIQYTIEHRTDTLQSVRLSLRVGAAPACYRWKRRWPFQFVKSLTCKLGGIPVWVVNAATLEMNWLIHGGGAAGPQPLFDYDAVERMQRSARPHEVLVELLPFQELLPQHPEGLPHIRLAYHTLTLELETAALEACLEPMGVPAPLGPAPPLSADIVLTGLHLEREERRAMAQGGLDYICRTPIYETHTVARDGHQEATVRARANNVCSATYVWVTDENGHEFPYQALRQIDALFSGNVRLSLTGFQARHMQGPSLPHHFVENTRSENLYVLSYFSGRRSAGGLEDGVNFSRIDHYDLRLQFEEGVPERLQVHVMHRSQNTLRFSTGMVNTLYHMANQPIVVEEEPMLVAGPPLVLDGPERRLQALVFANAEQDIAVPDSEPQCMITFEDIVEGATVERCRACRKIFSASGIFQWLRLRQQSQWICAHCRGTYGVDHFDRGVARLGPAATAAAAVRAAAAAEEAARRAAEESDDSDRGSWSDTGSYSD